MAFALVRPRELTRSELRRALPFATIAKMMATGALMGVLPRYDHTGEESGPADPLTAAQRIDLADKLLRKGLPDLKTDEPVDAPHLDASSLPTDPDSLRRLTTAQIREALQAEFSVHADPEPLASAPTAPVVQPDPEPAPSPTAPTRGKRTRKVPSPLPGGGD